MSLTPDMWITLAILVAAAVLFVTEWVRLDVVALGVVAALILTGVLPIEQALAGFSNKTVISLAALFIVGGAVFHTGLAGMIGDRIVRIAGGSQSRLLVVLMSATALLSAFISSTGVVALMLPAVVSLANRLRVAPSRLLIPLAYSALVGGATTLIGTPPNLLASDALRRAGYAPFSLFDFTPVGGLLLGACVLYMLLVGRRVLPERRPEGAAQQATTPGELFALYQLPNNLFRLRVQRGSPLAGQTVQDSGLRQHYDLTILSITRPNHAHEPPRSLAGVYALLNREQTETILHPPPDFRLQEDDVLLVQGDAEQMSRASAAHRLAVMAADPVAEGDVITNEVGIAEVILRPRSSLIGQTLLQARFGSLYHLTVLSLRRPGVDEPLDLKRTPLAFGDVLLVQGEWRHIFALKRLRQDFIVMGEREAAEVGAFSRQQKAPLTLLILAAMVALVGLNLMELVTASLLAALAVVLTGCMTMDDAYQAVDWKSLVLVAGMLPLSTALEQVGMVSLVAGGLAAALGPSGPVMVLAGLFLLTALLTQVISNTTTAVLIAPVALATAQTLGVQPQAFLMAVAVAASMAFATPVATPVNTLVITPGAYRFRDYLRAGIPLILIALVVAVAILPLLWPF